MPCMFTTGIAGPPNAATSMSSRSNFSIFIPFTPLLFFVLKPRTSRIARYLLGNLSCLSCCAVGQSICQATFNGEFCNNRDAVVHADGCKSKFPERVAQALRGEEFTTCGHANWGRSWPLLSCSRLWPRFRANRTKRRDSITNFSFTTPLKRQQYRCQPSLFRKHRLVSGLLCLIYLQLCIAG